MSAPHLGRVLTGWVLGASAQTLKAGWPHSSDAQGGLVRGGWFGSRGNRNLQNPEKPLVHCGPDGISLGLVHVGEGQPSLATCVGAREPSRLCCPKSLGRAGPRWLSWTDCYLHRAFPQALRDPSVHTARGSVDLEGLSSRKRGNDSPGFEPLRVLTLNHPSLGAHSPHVPAWHTRFFSIQPLFGLSLPRDLFQCCIQRCCKILGYQNDYLFWKEWKELPPSVQDRH